MSVIGIGVDIVEVERLQRAVDRTPGFVDRVFAGAEQAECRRRDGSWQLPRLAARFAAKEAVAKAFGTGIDGFDLREVEVVNDEDGRPQVVLTGRAEALAAELGVARIHLSLTHAGGVAVAQVVAEGVPGPDDGPLPLG